MVKETLTNLLRLASRANPVLGILMYLYVRCGSCAPCSHDLPALATVNQSFLNNE